jgi:hypothetical protein
MSTKIFVGVETEPIAMSLTQPLRYETRCFCAFSTRLLVTGNTELQFRSIYSEPSIKSIMQELLIENANASSNRFFYRRNFYVGLLVPWFSTV